MASSPADRSRRERLARHVFACLIVPPTAFLILWGGFVTSHGAGLSVPDWPTSYGMLWPPMVGNIFWEHWHRTIAAGVGVLVVILWLWTRTKETRPAVRRLAVAALALVIVQGLLGGLTVRLMLPTWVSTTHACLAQVFFCTTILMAYVTSPRIAARATPDAMPPYTDYPRVLRWLAVALVVAVFLQLLVGALMRHTHSGLAVPDFPYAYGMLKEGQVIPSLAAADLALYNQWRKVTHGALEPVTAGNIVIHMLHRLGAIVVVLGALAVAAVVFVRARRDRTLLVATLVLLLLLAVQVTLGAMTIWSMKAPIRTSFHVMVGALIFGCAWFMTLRAWHPALVARWAARNTSGEAGTASVASGARGALA